ncbi:hypothetical protein SAMN05421504_103471 [Amycolatopsis xylanica]|uniref:Uncharacterized protein n=2 Tax=Amycolatopsis xylanica TaxID=589385 RepID=A0A1H3DPV4_9PSEU|nr:hypothetical protein SAMN05421504_103471 [Amycolatopsis xylanica]
MAGMAGTSNATEAQSAWSCDGDACIRVVPDGGATTFDMHGCNHKVCVNVTGNSSSYKTSGYYSGSNRFYGHVNVWGPGGMWVEGKDSAYPGVAGVGRGSGQTCAEGWEWTGSGYVSVGLPCQNL